jgi:hypothetical protein
VLPLAVNSVAVALAPVALPPAPPPPKLPLALPPRPPCVEARAPTYCAAVVVLVAEAMAVAKAPFRPKADV